MAKMIPAFLCIDAEPNERSPLPGQRPWTGFESLVDFVDGLRRPLAERSGIEPHPTWFIRMDPIIDQCFGRADYAFHAHRRTFDRLLAHGDPLAMHVHAHRWDHEAGHTYADHTDLAWARHCVEYSSDVFERTFGERPRRASLGARYAPEAMVDALIDAGVQVDLTVEPGLEPIHKDSNFADHATGPTRDFRGSPRYPYRVSRRSLTLPASSEVDARPLVEIPRTTYDVEWALARLRRRAKMRLLRLGAPTPLNVYDVWPSAKTFWDLIRRAADESPLPFICIAIRSDPPSWGSQQIVRELMAALPNHPLAERLGFVDPLAFAALPAGEPSRASAPRRHWLRTMATELESKAA